jgi:RHS repeat-associated protein
VTYQYDELNRLISAVTADNPSVPQWGQSFTYDGFGNLTDKSVTKGSAPLWHGLVDPATNRASGHVYDANGNAGVSGLLYTYDIENRLTFQVAWAQSTEYGYGYGYNPDNRRVYKTTSTYDPGTGGFTIVNEEITFWGATGQRMGTYSLIVNPGGGGYAPSLTLRWMSERAYFGGRMIWRSDGTPQAVYSNRLGSIGKYFPYGEERPSATVGNAEKFATYYRESATGLDYAMNRYYDSGTGRFLTTDPSGLNAVDLRTPTSWNMYAYVNADPVNFNDPTGLDCSSTPFYFNGQYQGTVGDIIGSQSDVAILATAMYTESGHGPDIDVTDEEYAIGSAIMNRWEFVNKNWYLSSSAGGPSLNVSGWGTPGDSIVSIVENPSQFAIYQRNADGSVSLSSSAQRNLNNALSSSVTSSGCNDLAWALTLAFGMWDERNDGNPLYLWNDLILTGFNSFDPAHPSAPYEQKAGSFGDANTFYGVPDSYVSETPIRRRPVRPRRARASGEPQ